MLLQTEEFEHDGVLEEISRLFYDLSFDREAANFVLVPAEGEALVEAAGDLPLKFTDAPLVGVGLGLIEPAFRSKLALG